jgi:hypothetical protein
MQIDSHADAFAPLQACLQGKPSQKGSQNALIRAMGRPLMAILARQKLLRPFVRRLKFDREFRTKIGKT